MKDKVSDESFDSHHHDCERGIDFLVVYDTIPKWIRPSVV